MSINAYDKTDFIGDNIMTFSFIIPVYNTAQYLDECVQSILNQSYDDYEIILVDDGSTDGSGQICDEYSKKHSKIKVIHQKNAGLSAARNTGIKNASGEYFFLLDSDDFWLGDYLGHVAAMCENNPDMVVYSYQPFENKEELKVRKAEFELPSYRDEYDGTSFLKDVLELALERNTFYRLCAWCYCYKRNFFIDNGFQYPVGKNYEDLRLTWQVILAAQSVAVMPEIIYAYRKGVSGSITSINNYKNISDRLEQVISNIEDIRANGKIDSRLQELLEDCFCESYFIIMTISDLPATAAERKSLMKSLKENAWISKCSLRRVDRIVARLIDIFGVRFVCMLLHIRRKIIYHGQFRRA